MLVNLSLAIRVGPERYEVPNLMVLVKGLPTYTNVMTPGAGAFVLGRGHISHIVKMQYFSKNLLLHFQAWVRQTKHEIMMTKERTIKILNLTLAGQEYGHIVKMQYFLSFSCLYRGMDDTN